MTQLQTNTKPRCGDSGGLNAWGEPCQRFVKNGYTRCPLHGALQPSAVAKAEFALALARMPAIAHLHERLEQFSQDRCPTCGYPKADTEQVRAEISLCKTILDRTGMPPRVSVEVVKKNDDGFDAEQLTTEERRRMIQLVAEIKQIKALVRARLLGHLMNPPLQAPAAVPLPPAVDGEIL